MQLGLGLGLGLGYVTFINCYMQYVYMQYVSALQAVDVHGTGCPSFEGL